MGAPVAIIGVGLMGGSLGLALQRHASCVVSGYDSDQEALAEGVRRGAISVAADTLEEAVSGAQVVFLATPVGRLGDLARRVLEATDPDCIVTDVGSAKAAVVAELSVAERARFIGGHPICGGERSGVGAARDDLFCDATYFLTPDHETRPELFERLHQLIAAIGARPVAIDPEAHDRLMATVSHVPHVLASALINQAAETAPEGREALRSAGPSFTDLTRVGGANPPLWADILVANHAAVTDALDAHRALLKQARDAVARADRDWLLGFFLGAREGREVLLAGDGPTEDGEAFAVVVQAPDQPGVISAIATQLGHAHINIEDLSLVPGPRGTGGELRLQISGADAAERARELIAEIGYEVATRPIA